jgi:hypothetical protein
MEFLYFHVKRAFESIDPFFLVERNREQDGFHGVVAALVRSRLRVTAGAVEEAIEKVLVLAAQRAPEFRPARRSLLNELNECRDCAAHEIVSLLNVSF